MEMSGQLHLGCLPPQYPVDRRMGGHPSRSGCCGEQKNVLPLPEVEHWCLSNWAHSLVAILAELWCSYINIWIMLLCRRKTKHTVTTQARRNMYLLAKASAFLPDWELRRGVADCLEIPIAATKDLARQLSTLRDAVQLRTGRRHPVILILDEVLLLLRNCDAKGLSVQLSWHIGREIIICVYTFHLARCILCWKWLKLYSFHKRLFVFWV
jgi:hypothetical protein